MVGRGDRMSIIANLIITIFAIIGIVTAATYIVIVLDDWEVKFQSWRRKKCKIKWLCTHEYEYYPAPVYIGNDCYEYTIWCRKCGKKRKIIFYNELLK